MRRAAIYGSIMDSLVASILKYIPEEARGEVVQEQLRIMHQAIAQGHSFRNCRCCQPSVDLQGCSFGTIATSR